MNRIDVSSASIGPYNYRFPINPAFYNAQDSADISLISVLHGSDIRQVSSFDSRPRELIWYGFEVSDTNMAAIITYFRSIEGEIRYFNFQDLDSINNRWPTSNTWKKARILTISPKYRKGGKLRIDSVSLIIQPEQ